MKKTVKKLSTKNIDKTINAYKDAKLEGGYAITIKIGDNVLEGTGSTAYEALASIAKPVKIVGKGFLTIKYNGLKKEQMFMPPACKRLFYPQAQIFLAKQLVLGMK